ncbi:protein FAR1-related sequence 5 [Tanacetum coccineum]
MNSSDGDRTQLVKSSISFFISLISGFIDSSHSSARSIVSHNYVSSDVVVRSFVPSGNVLNAFAEEIVAYEKDSNETHAVKKLNALCTPESFVTHSNFDTPGGTVYYIPKVSADVLLVKGNVYDSVDDCVVAYMKYAAEAGFVVRRSCQKRMLNGDVKQKYLVCNRMGCPKGIHVDTLDLGNSDKQKRNSNLHITGCKARAVFNLDTCTRKFVLHVFDTIHNHELEREEYKHLSKTERQLTYMEQAFIVKAASVNIGATRAHHLLTGIKGSYLLVHGTTVDFKNFFRSVNCYIGDSDAQMLIHKMENRKKHVSDFSFDYLVENAKLAAIFWADEVSKYNYREFGDVVSFDATFKTNKYKMVFVPFTVIDNHKKYVTVAAGLLKNETTKSYIWLLKAFMEAFGKAPSIIVTDQDGAMRNAIEAEFGGSKHRLCMWHITQKLPAKICAKIYDETDFKEKLNKIVWNMYIGPEEFEAVDLAQLSLSFCLAEAKEESDRETTCVKKLDALCTPESFVTHSNFDTPGGTVYYIPKVYADVLLVKGNVYDSVDDCVVAYMKYVAEAGMGCPKGIHVDTLDLGNSDKQKRNSKLHITGCKARAVFNLDTRTRKFVLNVFDTIHNHELEREEYKHLSKTGRQYTYMEQAFIVKVASVNIGATITHHLLTGIKGSYLLVHGTIVDFKNFFRSVNCYIGDSDAQMLIHKMENRKKHVSDFLFDYLVENAELSAIFWADEVSKYNYRKFGDVVSFDATFKTNKYKMLLKAFMKAFGKAPSIVVIDQDGAMRNAIEADFGGSKHRLCMWHITQKLHAKICAKIYDETDFKEKLNKIVWNMYIGPEESESENSFFSYFTNSGSTLMNFMNCFETAMEKQRHIQERMDHKTIDIVPKLKTLLKIERHASNVYTRSLFELVQKEIFVGLFYCQIDSKCLVEGSEVLRNVGDGSVVCSCQLFVRVGILCKHIFCVFKNANVEMIPQQYILRHWTKNLIPAALRNTRNRYGERNVVVENYVNEATSFVDHCVQLLSKDESRLGAFIEKLKSLKKEVEADCPNPSSKNKTDNLEQLVGVPKPPVVDVNNPTVGSTKGRKKLRIKGGKEKAIEKSLKGRNSCSLCGGTNHNKRTCPGRFEVQDEVVVQKEVCQEEVVQEKVDLAEDEEELVEEDEDLIHE